jgi:hypothetical protein
MWLTMPFCANEKSLDTASTCGAFVVVRGVRLNTGGAVSCVNFAACCK